MSVFRRKGSDHWQIKFRLNGANVRRSSSTSDKKLAERIEHAAREEILKAGLEGHKAAFSWEQAQTLWLSVKRTKKTLVTTDCRLFKQMEETFGGMDVADITKTVARDYGFMVANRTSPSTANRHLALVSSVLRMLEEAEILERAPRVKQFKLQDIDVPFITLDEVKAVLAQLPLLYKQVATIAVLTGLRRANVLGLRWSRIDLAAAKTFVPAAEAKGNKDIRVPLPSLALEILTTRMQTKPEGDMVFPSGKRELSSQLTYEWKKARVAAGYPSLRFHDLRHAWASHHSVNHTPDRILQALGGWATPKQLQRYGKFREADYASFADNTKINIV